MHRNKTVGRFRPALTSTNNPTVLALTANRLMKLINAARFAGITFLVAGIYSTTVLQPIYRLMIEGQQQQGWLVEVLPRWTIGGWLLLLSILAWMTLLVTSMYSYSPVHRVSTMMQTGLIIIAAVLLILGILIGLTRMEGLAAGSGGPNPQETTALGVALFDDNAMALLRAGLLMGGAVSAWIGVDLALLGKLPPLWLAPAIVAGVALVPAPFLGLSAWQLLIALAGFLFFCLVLGARRALPESYPPLG